VGRRSPHPFTTADEPAVLSLINPEALGPDSRDRFHNEFHVPQGFIDAIAVGLGRYDDTIGSIGFNRHDSAGPIGTREIEALRLLLPHLQRAARISHLLDASQLAVSNLAQVLDGIPTPVFLLGAGMQLVHANAAGRAELEQGGILFSQGGRLRLASTEASGLVRRAVSAAAQPEAHTTPCGADIPLWSRDGVARAAHVIPIAGGSLGSHSDEAVCALFLAGGTIDSDLSIAATLFGFTEAEQRVFVRFARSMTIADTASDLGIGRSTVRTHLLRIFEKTQTHRQAELVALACSLTGPTRSAWVGR
jgi:DNA-binding CsgD family transcriptional regulator